MRYIHNIYMAVLAVVATVMIVVVTGCDDELSDLSSAQMGVAAYAACFNVEVLDAPATATRSANEPISARNANRDFKVGDSFGLFVIDGNGNAVEGYRNLKVTTPDGVAWNTLSSVKETVHKMGYKYYAYAPYSSSFDDCSTISEIESLFTAPNNDQSASPATDWMNTEATNPGTNGITTLTFRHKYGVIDIYNGYTLNPSDWLAIYKDNATKTTDNNGITHYRYVMNDENASMLTVAGTYNVGNAKTGIRRFSYNTTVPIGNGYHSTVRTTRVSEDYAVDLGLPSGTKWARFNLGAELGCEMTEEQILEAEQKWGARLAWGELWAKDTYSTSTYIDKDNTLFTASISGTDNDPVKMLWGGHWEMPSQADFDELRNNVTIQKTATITVNTTSIDGSSQREFRNVNVYRLTSNVEGYTDRSIVMVTSGYVSNGLFSSAWSTDFAYYTSGTYNAAGSHKSMQINPGCVASISTTNNFYGAMVRPVLKEITQWNAEDCERIVMEHLVEYAVDFGIRETIDGIEYATLWAPFNLGAEKTFASYVTYNGQAPIISDMIDYARKQTGWYLPWGATEPYADGNYSTEAWAKLPVYTAYHGKSTSTSDWPVELTDEYDAAKVNWGKWDSRWQLPTYADAQKFYNAVSQTTETGGKYGLVKATGKSEGYKSSVAYFPKCGYMKNKSASSTSNAGYMTKTMGIYNNEDKMYMMWGAPMKDNSGSCYTGVCVRPIIKVPVSELNR